LEAYELPVGGEFATIEQVRDFIRLVVRSDAWNAMGNLPNAVRVFDWGDSEYSQVMPDHAIWLARHHWNMSSVLHELAHIAAPKTHHGPAWVRSYLVLLSYFMGQYYADLYTKAFKREGVKF